MAYAVPARWMGEEWRDESDWQIDTPGAFFEGSDFGPWKLRPAVASALISATSQASITDGAHAHG